METIIFCGYTQFEHKANFSYFEYYYYTFRFYLKNEPIKYIACAFSDCKEIGKNDISARG